MVDALVDAYANLCSRFEISYSLPASAEPGPVKLKICSGFGQADIVGASNRPAPAPRACRRRPRARGATARPLA